MESPMRFPLTKLEPLSGRDRVQPLLGELCAGAAEDDLLAAVSGLLAASASVRDAALTALPAVPAIAASSCPADPSITAVLWLAKHDASPGESALPGQPTRPPTCYTCGFSWPVSGKCCVWMLSDPPTR